MNEFLTIRNFIPSLTIAQKYPWIGKVAIFFILALIVGFFAYLMNSRVCMSISDTEEWYEIKRKCESI